MSLSDWKEMVAEMDTEELIMACEEEHVELTAAMRRDARLPSAPRHTLSHTVTARAAAWHSDCAEERSVCAAEGPRIGLSLLCPGFPSAARAPQTQKPPAAIRHPTRCATLRARTSIWQCGLAV